MVARSGCPPQALKADPSELGAILGPNQDAWPAASPSTLHRVRSRRQPDLKYKLAGTQNEVATAQRTKNCNSLHRPRAASISIRAVGRTMKGGVRLRTSATPHRFPGAPPRSPGFLEPHLGRAAAIGRIRPHRTDAVIGVAPVTAVMAAIGVWCVVLAILSAI